MEPSEPVPVLDTGRARALSVASRLISPETAVGVARILAVGMGLRLVRTMPRTAELLWYSAAGRQRVAMLHGADFLRDALIGAMGALAVAGMFARLQRGLERGVALGVFWICAAVGVFKLGNVYWVYGRFGLEEWVLEVVKYIALVGLVAVLYGAPERTADSPMVVEEGDAGGVLNYEIPRGEWPGKKLGACLFAVLMVSVGERLMWSSEQWDLAMRIREHDTLRSLANVLQYYLPAGGWAVCVFAVVLLQGAARLKVFAAGASAVAISLAVYELVGANLQARVVSDDMFRALGLGGVAKMLAHFGALAAMAWGLILTVRLQNARAEK